MEYNKEINHWCVLCGTGYHACDSCGKEKKFTPWRVLTDTIGHYKIFMVLKDYNNGAINREQAKELLSALDLSDKDNFKDSAKKVLADIYDNTDLNNDTSETNIEAVTKRKTRKPGKAGNENELISKEILPSDL